MEASDTGGDLYRGDLFNHRAGPDSGAIGGQTGAGTRAALILSRQINGMHAAPDDGPCTDFCGFAFFAHKLQHFQQPKDAPMTNTIIARCEEKGLRLTEQRRVVAAVLEKAHDHPDVEELYHRASVLDPNISLATVYRTVKLFEDWGLLEKHQFGDGRARYETADRDHHDHLIDLNTGEVIEFVDTEIEKLQEKIAARLGYTLKGHRLELYGVPQKRDKT